MAVEIEEVPSDTFGHDGSVEFSYGSLGVTSSSGFECASVNLNKFKKQDIQEIIDALQDYNDNRSD